jgi:hypothetical protein
MTLSHRDINCATESLLALAASSEPSDPLLISMKRRTEEEGENVEKSACAGNQTGFQKLKYLAKFFK